MREKNKKEKNETEKKQKKRERRYRKKEKRQSLGTLLYNSAVAITVSLIPHAHTHEQNK